MDGLRRRPRNFRHGSPISSRADLKSDIEKLDQPKRYMKLLIPT